MNAQVDKYLIDGCMRCKYGATIDCKVNKWKEELLILRQIVLESGLKEELKWSVPCYTFNHKNVLIMSAFKEYTCLSFLKGALLKDKEGILMKQGEHSQSARIIKYTDSKQIIKQVTILKSYIQEAIEIEQSGKKVVLTKNPESIPDELTNEFSNDSEFKKSFYALTPGRQRGYIIYFSAPKSAQSKINRIEKSKQNILNGIGLNDK
ncbi:MAG: YdeI/OmpD-associated family protein [Bacteroidota bacterium]